jgi:hypothetical protein
MGRTGYVEVLAVIIYEWRFFWEKTEGTVTLGRSRFRSEDHKIQVKELTLNWI